MKCLLSYSCMLAVAALVVFLSVSTSLVTCQQQQQQQQNETDTKANNQTEEEETAVKRTSLLIVKLNETIKLECHIEAKSNATTVAVNRNANATGYNETMTQQASTATTTAQSKSSGQNYSLFLFKKNDLLVQLHASHLDVHMRSNKDEGLYECGYYKVDKFGSLNYMFVQSWRVQIEEVKTTKRNLLKNYLAKSLKRKNSNKSNNNDGDDADYYYSSSELNDYDGNDFIKKNVNLFTRNPILMGLLCVFMIFVLVCILVLVSWMNTAATSRREKRDYLICANNEKIDGAMKRDETKKVIYESAPAKPSTKTDATFIQIN